MTWPSSSFILDSSFSLLTDILSLKEIIALFYLNKLDFLERTVLHHYTQGKMISEMYRMSE